MLAAKKKKEEDERLANEMKSSRRSSRARTKPVTYKDVVPQSAIAKTNGKDKKKKEMPVPPKSNTLCLCQQPVGIDKGGLWLGCDACGNWFHPKCVGLPTAFARRVANTEETWHCPECAEMNGQFGLKAIPQVAVSNDGSSSTTTTTTTTTTTAFVPSPKKNEEAEIIKTAKEQGI
jgi:hypothetical protein